MTRLVYLSLGLLLLSHSLHAQNTFPSTGSVGIGTTSPLALLDVNNAGTNVQSAILAHLPEDAPYTYLSVHAINSTPINSPSFSIEHHFYSTLNSAIYFYRGGAITGGFLTFATNNGTEQMRLDPSGNLGIGTTTPVTKLHVDPNGPGGVYIGNANGSSGGYTSLSLGLSAYQNGYVYLQSTSSAGVSWGNIILNASGGSVGIGTANPQGYKLAVNGSAIFTQAVVKSYANWPDYVLNKGYTLPTLDSLSRYITLNGHLPGIPDAASIQQDGQDLGELQRRQMQKIEELTRYAIDADKKAGKQDSTITGLQQEVAELREQVRQLTQLIKSAR